MVGTPVVAKATPWPGIPSSLDGKELDEPPIDPDDIARAEQQFGVPGEIIVAIIGVETEYGRNMGSFSVLNALATLGFYGERRREFFQSELEQYLLLARDNQLDLNNTRGSFAGAMGIPQFMPSSQRRWGVDYDGDGRLDLAHSATDAIGSVGNAEKFSHRLLKPTSKTCSMSWLDTCLVETSTTPFLTSAHWSESTNPR